MGEPVRRWRVTRLHHVAFAHRREVRMVDQMPRRGALGTTIAFVHPAASGGLLLELVGPPPAGVPVDEDQIAGRS